jgi:hypothetical protein
MHDKRLNGHDFFFPSDPRILILPQATRAPDCGLMV